VVGSFFVIGDWGYDTELHEVACRHRRRCVLLPRCQQAIADTMRAEARRRGNVRFVLNVGDNFYPQGVHGVDDPQWTEKWSDVYHGMDHMQWYSVYGNHDYEAPDWRCGCLSDPKQCHQVQKHGARHRNTSWYMPSTYYHARPLPGVNIEVVALDMNAADASKSCPWLVQSEGCSPAQCLRTLAEREVASARMLRERVAANRGGNLLVVSHYPTDFLLGRRPGGIDTIGLLRSHETRISYFGGHRHATAAHESGYAGTASIAPNRNWLTGGGGGWACDGQQGFLVGEIMADGRAVNVETVLIDDARCCTDP